MKVSRTLAPDDLRCGTWIAVAGPRRRRVHRRRTLASARGMTEAYFQALQSEAPPEPPEAEHPPVGVPLQLRGISLPFLVCAVLMPGGATAGPIVLDMRKLELVRLAPSYVRAVKAFPTHDSDAPDEPDDFDEAPGAMPDGSDLPF